jgi:Ca-activated chloride channel family protein
MRKPAGPVPIKDDIRDLLAVEARRLAEAEDRPAYERRDLLADLASRLRVLLEGQTDPGYEQLRALVGTLTGDGDLEEKWKAARQALDGFGKHERKAFWKR